LLDWLERNQTRVLLIAGALLLAGLGADRLSGSDSLPAVEFRYGSGQPTGAPIRVDVAGAVVHPGVYELREGDRLAEALAAAGGPSNDADTDALNLARRVRDEEQVVVPKRTPPKETFTLTPGAKLDLNTATESQLDALPGIGEVYARRIVDSRAVDGPFLSVQDLVDRRVVPRATFDKVRDLVFVEP
jgi:competence protein ComEA